MFPNKVISLNKIFLGQDFVYEVNISMDEIIYKLKYIINQKNIFDFEYNLDGELFNDNTFLLTRRMGLIHINGGSSPPVTLMGKVNFISENKSSINLNIKPNYIFIIFSIVFTILALIVFVQSLFIREPDLIGLVFLIVPILMGLTSFYTQQYHRMEFERALGIELK